MNRTVALVLTGLLAVAVLPAASAHVTVTSVPPSGPVQPGVPTTISVTLSVNCAIYVAEYQAAQVSELQLALVPTADAVEPPAYLPFVGEIVPFTLDMCDPTAATIETTGLVTVNATTLAPAFQPIPLQPGAVGETNEGGAFNLTVAYHAALANVAPMSLTAGTNGSLELVLTANADTVLKVEAVDETGHAHGEHVVVAGETAVDSPLLAGAANRTVTLAVQALEAGNSTLRITPVAKQDGSLAGLPIEVAVRVLPAANATDDHHDEEHEHDEESKDTPAPVAPLLAVALLALALRRRR